MRTLASVCILVLILYQDDAFAEAAGSELSAQLRALIIKKVGAGERPSAYLTVFGEKVRAKVSAAVEKTLTVQAKGNTLPLPWSEIGAEEQAHLALEVSQDGSETLLVARRFFELKLFEHVEKACMLTLQRDRALGKETAELLAGLPDRTPLPASSPVAPAVADPAAESAPAKPDLAKLTGVANGAPAAQASRVNHEGRVMPPLPAFDKPLLYNTPECDAVLAAVPVFPSNNAWNEDISKNPVLPDSEAMLANLTPAKGIFVDFSFTYVCVPAGQARVDLAKMRYASESDKGPYPIPDNCPVEGWPEGLRNGSLESLLAFQRESGGDRHALVLDAAGMKLFEFYTLTKTDAGWTAGCAALFDLTGNKLRPDGWTSSDAAGLPVFPGLIRYDEVERGMVEHAIRVTFDRTRKEYIYPATHHAGATTDKSWPAMGQRLRLKADVNLDGLPPQALAVAKALKKYGLIVADNGSNWFMSATADHRFNIGALKTLGRIKGQDFEVVQTTGPNDLGRGGAR
ncbi:MAG: hypothetical protein M5U26_00540 [Planctomycetota bacterium]|nr:hypothetical protein [Planctomycetota bacterium]